MALHWERSMSPLRCVSTLCRSLAGWNPRGPCAAQARRRIGVTLFGIALLCAGWTAWGWRYQVIPRRLHEVAPGLFRSAQLEPWPLESSIASLGIRTIVRLNDSDEALATSGMEASLADRLGVEVFSFSLPPHGCASFAELDQIADLIALRLRAPLLVHCEAGLHRTSAAIAAYRMRGCGWSWPEAAAELRRYGPRVGENNPLWRHLQAYGERLANARRSVAGMH